MKDHPTPSGNNVGYALGVPDDDYLTADNVPALEYEAATAVKAMVEGVPGLPWDKQAAIAMVAAILIVGEKAPDIKVKRGKVINAMTEEFRRRLQLYLPL